MVNSPETILEIDLDALQHNYQFIKSQLKENTKLLAVVKAFAYGSDPVLVAKKLESLSVDYFAVAYINEGVVLRKAGIKTPILVLHPQEANLQKLIDFQLEPNLYSWRILKSFKAVAENSEQINYPIHLKFNTGLNRLGFQAEDVGSLGSLLKTTDILHVKSIFSHLVASEDEKEQEFTKHQITSFDKINKDFCKLLGYKFIRHQLNTSGIFNYPKAQFEMVRCGIGLFGFANDPSLTAKLKPVLSLKSVISQIHQIKAGETVGYNRKFKANNPMKSATIPIGHADGIHRAFGNRMGFVNIHDQVADIIGNVCMDMIMVDVSHIDCKEGDEVIIFNDQESLEHLATRINSISYELLTAISQRVQRVIK